MYSYTHDPDTGGLLLNSSPTKLSKEPRPVYAPELDLMGFNQYWHYDGQTEVPYMWAEANRYWYRGRAVASLKGGNVYTAPEIQLAYICKEWRETPNGKAVEKTVFENPNVGETFTVKRNKVDNIFTLDITEPKGRKLRPVDIDAMMEANRELIEIIEATTVKKILAVYEKYAKKLDIFHVAFSGGKDSCVLLDLCKKALPKDSFVVVFGDTMMEFPDTYDLVDEVEEACKRDGVKFYRAYSHMSPEESWGLFGPPSRTLRWCCSVHKSAPQTLKLREITGKQEYSGLAYVGVRAEESATRSEYEYENYGKKQKGQFSHNAILEWTSAEVWLYIYANRVIINKAYKKGSQRVGCVCCPMSAEKASYINHSICKNDTMRFHELILKSNSSENMPNEQFIGNGGWVARKNGRFLATNTTIYCELYKDGNLLIEVEHPKADWKEWIKALGDLITDKNDYTILYQGIIYNFTVIKNQKGYTASMSKELIKKNSTFGKYFRQVFRKSAYCINCGTCQSMCKNGCITFTKGVEVKKCINCKDCRHCKKYDKCKRTKICICSDFEYNNTIDCHSMSNGCLAYDSLKIPQGENEKMKTINCFSTHAPTTTHIANFFEEKDDYFANYTLGGQPQKTKVKRFMKDAGLLSADTFNSFAELGNLIKWDSSAFLGLMLINLVANNPQFEWYTRNLDVGIAHSRDEVKDMLIAHGQSKDNTSHILSAFGRIIETPFGSKLNWGMVADDGSMTRTTCSVLDPRVILYGLYVYNEKANAHYEFRLNTFYENLEQDGIPPTTVFGFDRQTVEPMLRGLSAKYPEFINYSDTNDLCKISLREDKTPQDVLELFREDK